jgi:hypothetical protein
LIFIVIIFKKKTLYPITTMGWAKKAIQTLSRGFGISQNKIK